MKQLPCDRCGTAKLPNGRPNLLGRAPIAFPFRVMCCQCKRPTVLRAADWNRLPELTNAELDAMGELEPLLRDLEGAGHSAAEAADLFRCNWTPVELAGLGSPSKPPETAVAMKVESIDYETRTVTLSGPFRVQDGQEIPIQEVASIPSRPPTEGEFVCAQPEAVIDLRPETDTIPEPPAQAPEPSIRAEIDPVTGKKTYFIQGHPPLTQAEPPRKPRKPSKPKPKPKTIKKPKNKPTKPARKVERGRLKG